MGATDLHDRIEGTGPVRKRPLQMIECRAEVIAEGKRDTHVQRRGHDVVRRLAKVHVVVRVHRHSRSERLIGELTGPVGDHLVDVRVRRRARPGLEDIDGELIAQAARDDLPCDLLDQAVFLRIQPPEFSIGCRASELDESKPANKRVGHRVSADWKVEHGALGGGAVQRAVGHGHFAH